MQIREIHIERFGIFSRRRIVPVSPGLNVVYGRNESGKTTLLEFIRWVLFGFEKKRKGMNSYTPVDGGEHLGTLMCEMANDERIFISRTGGTLEGQVTVQAADREGSGQAHLETYLGHASRKIFKNIYAFALDELQNLDSLMEEEIKNKILGAGMGLGQVSLTEVEKEIREKQDELFKQRGRSDRVLDKTYREIRKREEELRARFNEVDQYDELNKKIEALEQARKKGESDMGQLESRRRTLEVRRELFPDFIDLKDKAAREKELAGVPAMEEESMLVFEKVQTKIEDSRQRLEEEKGKLHQLKLRRDPIIVNQPLLDRETEIIQLRQLTELVRSAQADKHAVLQERDQLREKIRSEIDGINRDWDADRVLTLEWIDPEKQFVEKREQALFHSEQFVENVKNRLELHQEQLVTDSTEQNDFPKGIRVSSWVLMGIGALGAGFALFSANMELGIFMGVMLACGIGLYAWASFSSPDSEKEDLLDNLLRSKLEKAENDLEEEKEVWEKWVEDKGLDPETSIALFKEIQIRVRAVKEWAHQKQNLNERIERMRKKEEEAEKLVAALSECVSEVYLAKDLLINIDMLSKHFDEAREDSGKCQDLDSQINEQTGRIEGIVAPLESQQESLDHLLQSAKVDSEESFLLQWNSAQEKSALGKSIQEIQTRIQTRVGLGEVYQRFMESMQDADPEQLEQELADVLLRLSRVHEEQNRVNQEIGQFRGEAAQLASREDLVRLHNELESKKVQLMNGAREWATLTLALEMLDQAKMRYEKTRQPQVFQAAGRMFSQITNGNYQGVEKPLESDEFRIVQGNGGFKSPVQLSRGTREQLYLSMRFGLIEDYETRAEPLPIVMDDVFVNFDDIRREHVLDILREFARDRQVIILSCHEHLLETYLKYGAKQVDLQRE
ncbi:MAG: AAA family ATPase [Nitrospinaceae bacterium]